MTHRNPAQKEKSVGIYRWAKYTAEAYSDPEQFSSPQEFLAAISECLEEVCLLHGKEPPDLSTVEFKGPRRLSA